MDTNTLLSNIYYNPVSGFGSFMDLYKTAKEQNKKLTVAEVKQWYDRQGINQIYKQPQRIKKFNKISATEPGSFQMDLVILKKFGQYNRGYKYLLNIIDIYSRYAWSFPLKTKLPKEIAPYVKQVLSEVKKKYPTVSLTFTMDQGGEFQGDVSKVFKDFQVKLYKGDVDEINAKRKVGMIERFNRTLVNKIKKWMAYKQSLEYVDALPQLLHSYNNTKHSSTLRKPKDIFINGKVPINRVDKQQIKLFNSKIEEGYKVGDTVRYQLKNSTFSKRGFEPKFSLNTYKITEKHGNRYTLANGKIFYEEQLIRGDDKDFNTLGEKIKEVKKKEKFERDMRADFGEPVEEVEKQILSSKRTKKQTDFYRG